ncbi:uncharacterized protein N7477_006319 [Penicillium maclennaniae]|uniref:uncharacterized protein n=1 Tax=Penicillium maclennaniae TaxID=1343394 RepID=UPI00253FB9BF|nr:uncharacterized protein N7477_006319 [Penicillium maclennaniae]KAJ5667749.1 hypothetical protein N7477_006319 [Penicillium maclennaniae]
MSFENEIDEAIHSGTHPEFVVQPHQTYVLDTRDRNKQTAMMLALKPNMQKDGKAVTVVSYMDISDAYKKDPVKVRVKNRVMRMNTFEVYYASMTLKSWKDMIAHSVNAVDPGLLQNASAAKVHGASSAGSSSGGLSGADLNPTGLVSSCSGSSYPDLSQHISNAASADLDPSDVAQNATDILSADPTGLGGSSLGASYPDWFQHFGNATSLDLSGMAQSATDSLNHLDPNTLRDGTVAGYGDDTFSDMVDALSSVFNWGAGESRR